MTKDAKTGESGICGLILAGGDGSRMGGVQKETLLYQGKTFLEHLETVLGAVCDRVVVARKEQDWILNCGPAGGLASNIRHGFWRYFCVAACDMPLLKKELYEYLIRQGACQSEFPDAVVPVTSGMIHPLAAVYHSSAGTVFRDAVEHGCCRIQEILKRLRVLYVDVTGLPYEKMLYNVNRLEDYQSLEQIQDNASEIGANGKDRRIVAVCGVKNSGKTTLLVKLLELCGQRGVQAAVIKHDGHEFCADVPGTDSWRFAQAGACGSAVFSDTQSLVWKKRKKEKKTSEQEVEKLALQFPDAKIVFVEGMKESEFPKIEVIRRTISDSPVSDATNRFLLVTDWEPDHFSENAVGMDDTACILDTVLKKIR